MMKIAMAGDGDYDRKMWRRQNQDLTLNNYLGSGISGDAAFAEWLLQMFELTLLLSLLTRMMAIEADQV